MNLSYRALACACFILLFNTQFAQASKYVPWQNNDYSIFTSSNSLYQKTIRIDNTSSIWRHLTDFSGLGATWLYSGVNSEIVKLYSPDNIPFQTFVDFSQPVGTANSINILPCNTGYVRIAEKGISLRVKAGLFQDVIRLSVESNCSDAGVTNIWFAKDIGIIQWTELNIAGEITYQLSQASIGGQVYPSYTGVTLLASFPRPRIFISLILPIPQDTPRATLGLQIENNTADPIIYRFPNGSRHDIVIRDSQGNEVARWSRGLNFPSVVGEVKILPGGKYNIGGSIELVDNAGNVLPSGMYEFEISLTSYTPVKASQMIELVNPVFD